MEGLGDPYCHHDTQAVTQDSQVVLLLTAHTGNPGCPAGGEVRWGASRRRLTPSNAQCW